MAGYALVEAVKAKKGIVSDNGVAVLIGKDRQNIYNWKTTEKNPDAVSVLKLMIEADINAEEAIKLLERGFVSLSLLIMTGLSCALAIAGNLVRVVCILCQIIGYKKTA